MVLTQFPDIAHFQEGLDLTGAVLIVAKASQGAHYRDPAYPGFRAQAARLGTPFVGYHWLDTTPPPAQAANAYAAVGPDTPLMIDDEQGAIVVAHTLEFAAAYRALGGRVRPEYVPRWLWERSGSPDLRPLADAGLLLVASHYGDGPSSAAGWAPYGGVTPTILQYTDAQPFNGQRVDFNAYRGTLAQLRADLMGEDMQPTTTLSDGTSVNAALVETHSRTGYLANQFAPALNTRVDGLSTAVAAVGTAVVDLAAKVSAAGRDVDLAALAADVNTVKTTLAQLVADQADLRARLAAAYTDAP